MGKLLLGLMLAGCAYFGWTRLSMDIVSEIHHEDIFKDMAHLFVGSLFGIAGLATWLVYWMKSEGMMYNATAMKPIRNLFWILAWGMTILEVVAFKLHK